MTTQTKKKKKDLIIENPIEAVRDLAGDLTSSAKTDLIGGMADSAFKQIFGSPSSDNNLQPNQELNLSQLQNENIKTQEILAFQKQRETIEKSVFSYKEEVESKKQIEELLKQLKLLVKSTNNLSMEVAAIAVADIPANSGVYHVNFFEWLIKLVKSLRERVDESQTWLSAFKSRKNQKQYWNMFKKHGTSFGLSNERVVATQTG